MKKTTALAAALLSMAAWEATAQKHDATFLKIGNETITYGEFDYMYQKNCATTLYPISRHEYVRLFTNYMLKVAEAKALKMDTAKSYKEECKYYLDELSKSYLTDTAALRRYAEQQCARQAEEVRAVHVLLVCRPNTEPSDTLDTYNHIVEARKRVMAGEDIMEVAAQMSEDPSAKTNKGDLGYFGPFMMTQVFEDMAYNTPVGQVSEVFRTNFGYHFIKVLDRRKSKGEVKVRQIVKGFGPNCTPERRDSIAKAIQDIYAQVTAEGADFAKIMHDNTDDRRGLLQSGGFTPWITQGQVFPEFGDAAFSLEKVGDISKPFATRVGWHILRLEGQRNGREFDEVLRLVEDAKDRVEFIGLMGNISFANKLAAEYSFQWDAAGRDSLLALNLAGKTSVQRNAKLKECQATLATFGGKSVKVCDIVDKNIVWSTQSTPSEYLDKVRSVLLIDFEKSQLTNKHEEYRLTKNEYEQGLLVFEVMQSKIWNQMPDSATVEQTYEANKARYSKDGTFTGDIYFCSSPKVKAKIVKALAKGKREKAAELSMKHVTLENAKQGEEYSDLIWGDESDYVVIDGTRTDGTPLELDKCRGQVISDCHKAAEEKFMAELNAKFKPEMKIKIK